jgi:hypothetical protein
VKSAGAGEGDQSVGGSAESAANCSSVREARRDYQQWEPKKTMIDEQMYGYS